MTLFFSFDIFGITISAYDIFNFISVIGMFTYLILSTKEYSDISYFALKQKTQKRKYLISALLIISISIISFLLFRVFNPLFAYLFTENNANYYGSLSARIISVSVLSLLFRSDLFKTHDIFTPALPIQLSVAKIACAFAGCCHGFELENSFYINPSSHIHEFPIQILEALIAFILFFVIEFYKRNNKIQGSVLPLYLILYSISRFITEFFRADLPNVLFIFDAYQILSLIFLFFGTALFILCYLRQKQILKRST